jgi:transcriptional regulator with XRE-family HTH domain
MEASMVFNGSKIKTLREARGWTQSELAEKLGGNFKKQHVYAYEKGVCVPKPGTLADMARLFEVNMRVFFN